MDFQVKLKYKDSIIIQEILLKKYMWRGYSEKTTLDLNEYENYFDDTTIYFYIKNDIITYGTKIQDNI
jgi:hypothetical protein